MDKLTLYRSALKRAGLRMTEQRETICAWLAATERHPSPYEVFEELSVSHPEISRATVYNTLNTLQQLGAIVELSFGADHTHYDTDPSPHINLICLRCHTIVDYEGSLPLDAFKQRIVANSDFEPLALRFDVLGLCARCRAAETAASPAPLFSVHSSHPQSTNPPLEASL